MDECTYRIMERQGIHMNWRYLKNTADVKSAIYTRSEDINRRPLTDNKQNRILNQNFMQTGGR